VLLQVIEVKPVVGEAVGDAVDGVPVTVTVVGVAVA
jgi:hypothetical protein